MGVFKKFYMKTEIHANRFDVEFKRSSEFAFEQASHGYSRAQIMAAQAALFRLDAIESAASCTVGRVQYAIRFAMPRILRQQSTSELLDEVKHLGLIEGEEVPVFAEKLRELEVGLLSAVRNAGKRAEDALAGLTPTQSGVITHFTACNSAPRTEGTICPSSTPRINRVCFRLGGSPSGWFRRIGLSVLKASVLIVQLIGAAFLDPRGDRLV